MTRLRADALLLFTAVIWGTAFVAQKAGNEAMHPVAFVGVRFLLSAVALAPLAFLEWRRARVPLTRADVGLLLLIGGGLAVGSILQQVALVTTTATNAGFLTALYVVLVPFTAWLLTREFVRPLVLGACAISLVGAWLLTTGGKALIWSPGDVQLLISVVIWAFWISLVAIYLKRTNRPLLMAFVQFAITGLVASATTPFVAANAFSGVGEALPALLYTGLLSGALAFTIQGIAQRYTPPAEAALLMSLESVFAAIAGAVFLGERLSPVSLLGGALILLGVALVEVGPIIIGRGQSRAR
jgi:drug/metabolite transporter (DMT)-like permease